MRHNRKNIALFACALTFCSVASLTSCGNKEIIPDFVMPEEGFDTNNEVSIAFFHTMGKDLQDVLNAYIEVFNLEYPNIHVNHQSIGGYDDVKDQMTTALAAGGNECDIAYCYPDHIAQYNKKQALVTLNSLINDTTLDESGKLAYGISQEQINDFIPAYWEEGNCFGDGNMYSLPWSKSSEVMYYNKTYFEAKNLAIPDHWFSNGADDKTSMEYVCQFIKSDDPNSIPLGYDSDSNLFITMCEQLNSPYTSSEKGNHYLFDNATNKEFVTKFKDWYSKGYFTTKTLYGGYTSALFTSTDLVKSYISIGSSAGAGNQMPERINGKYPFEVGVAGIPQANPAQPKVISQGPSICLFRNKDPQKVLASWIFARWFTTNVDFQCQFSMSSGYTPVISTVNQNQIYANFLESSDLKAQSTKQCVAQKDAYFTSPVFVGSAEARVQVGGIFSAAISGQKTVDKAFEDALNELNYIN